ncbi:hypothetical protein L1887_11713 [Cichorium endivia]|nr:hypothetical protein L1887_11713 [Cichorium endivia]
MKVPPQWGQSMSMIEDRYQSAFVSSRAEQQSSLSATTSGNPLDILVIGGGATGSGVALDAATRGLRVSLVEREDFSSGTSSRSTKLIHGVVKLSYSDQPQLRSEDHRPLIEIVADEEPGKRFDLVIVFRKAIPRSLSSSSKSLGLHRLFQN